MSEFAEYAPIRPRGVLPAPVIIAEAVGHDLTPIATLTAEREGGVPEQYLSSIRAQLADSPQRCQLFVARLESAIVAFARVSWLETSSIPRGWYLSGVIVARGHRRRGIGRALTEHRISWLLPRADVVYYFASLQNQATIDLHGKLGFQEIERRIAVPGCSFRGGVGALYRLSLPIARPTHDAESAPCSAALGAVAPREAIPPPVAARVVTRGSVRG